MPGRSHPPLFDLLERSRAPSESASTSASTASVSPDSAVARSGGSATASPPAASAAVEVAPSPPKTDQPRGSATVASGTLPRPARRSPPASSPPPASASPRSGPAGDLRIPKPWAYGVAVGVVVLLLVIWSLGVRYGESRAEASYAASLTGPRLTPSEPSAFDSGSPAAPPPFSAPDGGRPTDAAGTPPPEATPAPATSAERMPVLFTSQGALDRDPRVEGNNYLKLASNVPFDQAVGAVVFLADRGVSALAVATTPVRGDAASVDRADAGANNPVRYDLFSLRGIPSERYSRSADERREHQRAVQRLGREWLQRPEGLINFDQTFWTKYQP